MRNFGLLDESAEQGKSLNPDQMDEMILGSGKLDFTMGRNHQISTSKFLKDEPNDDFNEGGFMHSKDISPQEPKIDLNDPKDLEMLRRLY